MPNSPHIWTWDSFNIVLGHLPQEVLNKNTIIWAIWIIENWVAVDGSNIDPFYKLFHIMIWEEADRIEGSDMFDNGNSSLMVHITEQC